MGKEGRGKGCLWLGASPQGGARECLIECKSASDRMQKRV